jgi:DNA polymerase III subunit epsilon
MSLITPSVTAQASTIETSAYTPNFQAFEALPWEKLCFVDVETTGAAPPFARVTELAVVSYSLHEHESKHWSRLVNPGITIPPEIRFLTGITNEMVKDAAPMSHYLDHFEDLLKNGLFVAHHARFDFGFLKHEFERNGRPWPASIRTLCTVRLSRLLDVDKSPHSLDAIRLRYRLPATDRHRALGDALALQHFFEALCAKHGEAAVVLAIKRLMAMPSLPSHLAPDALTKIPHTPGVYFFYGENNHPLYIGKSIDLRTRVASHFGQDHKSERGIRLASEIRRIEYQETPDELCALIKEQQLIHALSPSYNQALRKKQDAVLVVFQNGIQYVSASTIHLEKFSQARYYGPFSSKASAKKHLAEISHAQRLCLVSLGLERKLKISSGNEGATTACFSRQVLRCRGACCGEVDVQEDLSLLETSLGEQHINLNKVGSEPWQMADGQWIRYAQIMEQTPEHWRGQLFSPAIYAILKRHTPKHTHV